ncbi:MAG: beta-lactamase family protein [Alphaproteobacteria bacterium]|nr:beta-lactamase family protein [Alphaproteobacteria bacterium]
MLKRRILLGGLGAAAFAGPGTAGAQAPAVLPTASESAAMSAVAQAMMRKYGVPGLSIAIGAGGRVVYTETFGYADREHDEKVTSHHIFRVASTSKAITAVAIFTLIERAKLKLTDKVFGPGALLGTDFGAPPYHQFIDQITVDHLLMHTAGGWSNDAADPMVDLAGEDHRALITWVLANRKAEHPPGEKYIYSNFGFCVLGRIVEKLTGESYQAFVRREILLRSGAIDMRISGNTREPRAPGEVVYYDGNRPGDFPYTVDVARMDSHGGWAGSATSLVRFLIMLPTLLRPDSLNTMLTPSPPRASYARGWHVNAEGTHWHGGSLPGTAAIMVRTTSGLCWAALCNGGVRGAGDDSKAIDDMMWSIVRRVPAWHAPT